MAGNSNLETKQVLLASEAELYIEELKTYSLKEIGSPKWAYNKFFLKSFVHFTSDFDHSIFFVRLVTTGRYIYIYY